MTDMLQQHQPEAQNQLNLRRVATMNQSVDWKEMKENYFDKQPFVSVLF